MKEILTKVRTSELLAELPARISLGSLVGDECFLVVDVPKSVAQSDRWSRKDGGMAYDEGVAQRVREIVQGDAGITERKMFGGLAFIAHGHMFIGVLGGTLMARVGPDFYLESLMKPHVREMDFTGRPMKGFVYVEPEGFESDDALQFWVNRSHAFAASLPPKLPKNQSTTRPGREN